MTKRDELGRDELIRRMAYNMGKAVGYCVGLEFHSPVYPSTLAKAVSIDEGSARNIVELLVGVGFLHTPIKGDSGERGYKVNCACLEGLNSDRYLEEIARSCSSRCALLHTQGNE
jgi:hypothetical protein